MSSTRTAGRALKVVTGPAKTIRAVLYLRISEDRDGNQAGVTRRREDCTELCRTRGWELVGEYEDNDVSATSNKPRKAYQRMLADYADGRFDAIVSWDLDRLYRNRSTSST